MMYRLALFLVLTLTVIHSYGSVQVQMPEASSLQQPDEDMKFEKLDDQIRELQKNVSDLWSYIYELRQAVSQHLTHLREHQVELEASVHKMEHFHDGDQSAAHTHADSHGDDHHHHSGEHSHGSDHSSHSGEQHSHSGETLSHSGEQHGHSGEHGHHSHSYSHSYASSGHGSHNHDSHSHSHDDGDHHDHHDHKDSHETEDLQQQSQVAEPILEPIITPTQRVNHDHRHYHGSHSRTESSSRSPMNLMNENDNHHHHHSHYHHEITRSRNRTVVIPKYSEYNLYDFAVCNVQPNRAISEDKQQNIAGQITFWQKKNGGPLSIHVSVRGFEMGDHAGHHGAHQAIQQEEDNETPISTAGHKHGFHIHTFGDLSNGCQSTGPHYNPKSVNHSGPNSLVRHVGDLGNIECDEYGVTNIIMSDDIASLRGQYSIIGKALVIHEKADDLGLGGDAESLKTGNAGTRIACCVIESVEKLRIKTYKALKSATQYQNR